MIRTITAAALLIAAASPAMAQDVRITSERKTSVIPALCTASVRVAPEQWEDRPCSHVDVSTAGNTHNLSFHQSGGTITYITARAQPSLVTGLAVATASGTSVIQAVGQCKQSSPRIVICRASSLDRSLALINGASFSDPGDLAILQAVIR